MIPGCLFAFNTKQRQLFVNIIEMLFYTGLFLSLNFLSSSSFVVNSPVSGVSFVRQQQHFQELRAIISGTKDEDLIDEGAGGVRLAKESAIKISGKGKDGETLTRYTQLTELDLAGDSSVLAKGLGKEFFQDPGKGLQADIKYAPIEAIQDALNQISTSDLNGKIILNFCGGDDLKTMEVSSAIELFLALTKMDEKNIMFNSMCHTSFPEEVCTVTIVRDDGESSGEVYHHSGKWYTLLEQDINNAVE